MPQAETAERVFFPVSGTEEHPAMIHRWAAYLLGGTHGCFLQRTPMTFVLERRVASWAACAHSAAAIGVATPELAGVPRGTVDSWHSASAYLMAQTSAAVLNPITDCLSEACSVNVFPTEHSYPWQDRFAQAFREMYVAPVVVLSAQMRDRRRSALVLSEVQEVARSKARAIERADEVMARAWGSVAARHAEVTA